MSKYNTYNIKYLPNFNFTTLDYIDLIGNKWQIVDQFYVKHNLQIFWNAD